MRFTFSFSFVLNVLLTLCSFGCADDKPTEHPYRIEHRYGIGSGEFERTVGNLLGPPLAGGNAVTTLVNGDQIFPPMLEAIRGGKKTIDFETYIYWRGDIGKKFTDALSERASNGVEVHVILDVVGSDKIDKKYMRYLNGRLREILEMTEIPIRILLRDAPR